MTAIDPATLDRDAAMDADAAASVALAPPLEVVHADAACVVVVKPAGLLSVPGLGPNGACCLSAQVQAVHADALIVHRLDMATSGLMVFARGAAAQRRLGMAFAAREVIKRCEAVVHGRPAPGAGEIALPLGADWPNRPRQRVDPLHGKPSLTRYRTIVGDSASPSVHAGVTTRLALEPTTGRAHQLRVHLLAIGHPIVGDALYAPAATEPRPGRLLLHATALGFAHPSSGAPLAFESAAPF